MKKINLGSNNVLNKKFQIALSGYNATEVDEFLDKILEDYSTYEQVVRNHEATIEEKMMLLNDKDEIIEKLKIEISNLKMQLEKTGKATHLALEEQMKAMIKEIAELKKQR